MAQCFIFPGQGSQAVGMGKDLYDNHLAAREVFDEVDEAISREGSACPAKPWRSGVVGRKLSDIIFNGPLEELTLTANVQPAIFAVSMAMWRVAQESGISIKESDFVAGHSLGEYTALCAAGAVSISDTARLLRLRGDAMQCAVPVGMGMVSVIMGLDFDSVIEICKLTGAEIANDNGANQFVISGLKESVERAMELAKERGAKRAMPLPLSAPVHCSLQAPTAEIMRDALALIEMRAPDVPLISNKTARPMNDVSEIKDALVWQITHGVRWRESVLNMPQLGITDTIEVGPGSVLTGLVSRIVPEINAKKLEV
jgi:[acyl-carrier-protein] S-malonyltransferase